MDVSVHTKVMDLLLDTVCVVDEAGRYVFVSASCERLFGYTPQELVGRSMIELVHPEDRERTLATAREVMAGRPQTHFENRYLRKDGRVVHIMWSARWSESDRLRLAVARDVTELRRAERVKSALYAISEAAHAAEDLAALCRKIHRTLCELLPAENFCVALYEASSDTLSFPYCADECGREPQTQPLGSGSAIAEVVRSGQPLLMTLDSAVGRGGRSAALPDADWLGVPLVSQDGVMGALVVQAHAPGVRYTAEDRDLLQFVSTQIASAIERKQAETQLRYMACHDALTGLPNRALFLDRLETALRRARRSGEQLALLYLDLDDFKDVNDTFGHEAGDRLLREVAQRLVQCVRASDTVGRMGGDEFTVLLTPTGGPDAVGHVVEKIRAALGAPLAVDGHAINISASIGAALYPEQGSGADQLLRHADIDMYAAKGGSRQARH